MIESIQHDTEENRDHNQEFVTVDVAVAYHLGWCHTEIAIGG